MFILFYKEKFIWKKASKHVHICINFAEAVIIKLCLPWGAEGDNVFWGRACYDAYTVIKCITSCCRTDLFKTPGIVGWQTCYRIGICSSTTVFVGVESITCAPASNDLPVGLNSQSGRAILSEVPITTRNATISLAINRRNYYRQIKSIDKANIVEINITKSELGNGVGWVTRDCAVYRGATATCLTSSSAVFIKTATGSCPHPATPSGRGVVEGGLAL